MLVSAPGIVGGRRRMRRREGESHLCKLGLPGQESQAGRRPPCLSRAQRGVSLFVLDFASVCSHSKWMCFISSATGLHLPSPLPWWATRGVSGVSWCCQGQADSRTKLGKGLAEDSWPNCITDAQPAESVDVCVILYRLRWYVLRQQCRKKDNQAGHGSVISVKLNIINRLQYKTRGWKWLDLWLQKGHQYRMSFLREIQENV